MSATRRRAYSYPSDGHRGPHRATAPDSHAQIVFPGRTKRQGVDEDIARYTEYDPDTECLRWNGAMHATGRFPVLDPEGDYFAVRNYLFSGLPGARRPGYITVWEATCGARRCVAFLHAQVRAYRPKERGPTDERDSTAGWSQGR